MSTRLLLGLALDVLGALAAGRLESGTGDVGGSFCLAAGLVGVVGVGVVNGVGNEDPPFRLRGGVRDCRFESRSASARLVRRSGGQPSGDVRRRRVAR